MNQTRLLIHMLGYEGDETLGKRFRDAVRVHGYEPKIVNSVVQLYNSTYDTSVPEVVA